MAALPLSCLIRCSSKAVAQTQPMTEAAERDASCIGATRIVWALGRRVASPAQRTVVAAVADAARGRWTRPRA